MCHTPLTSTAVFRLFLLNDKAVQFQVFVDHSCRWLVANLTWTWTCKVTWPQLPVRSKHEWFAETHFWIQIALASSICKIFPPSIMRGLEFHEITILILWPKEYMMCIGDTQFNSWTRSLWDSYHTVGRWQVSTSTWSQYLFPTSGLQQVAWTFLILMGLDLSHPQTSFWTALLINLYGINDHHAFYLTLSCGHPCWSSMLPDMQSISLIM